MKDIASDLGLSIVTISKALRAHPDISETTRQRVLAQVRARDYQPNILARSLVTGRSYLAGLIVPDLIHPFFAEIARCISLAIRRSGYSLILASSEEDPDMEAQEIRQLLAHQLDVIVIASTAMTSERFDRLDEKKQPYILIDRSFAGRSGNFVGSDDETAGYVATKHLIEQGCKYVAHIRGQENSTGSQRLAGYRKALSEHGVPYREEYVVASSRVDSESTESGAEAARQLLACKRRPDGIFCYNDPLAIGAMGVLLDAGLRIPEDIALVGCGNLHYDTSLRVPLSSMDQHSELIGETVGTMILDMLESKKPTVPHTVILQPSLVIRASSQRKRPL